MCDPPIRHVLEQGLTDLPLAKLYNTEVHGTNTIRQRWVYICVYTYTTHINTCPCIHRHDYVNRRVYMDTQIDMYRFGNGPSHTCVDTYSLLFNHMCCGYMHAYAYVCACICFMNVNTQRGANDRNTPVISIMCLPIGIRFCL